MLNKLLKYDLKYMLKNMLVFYILSLFFAILTRILGLLNESFLITLIYKISIGCMFSMLFSVLFNTIIRSWVRFKDYIYKDESYLTHTLPVTKTEIYESKFIQTILFSIVGFIIILICLLIAFYTKDNWVLLKNYVNDLSISLNINILWFIISVIIVLFLEIINTIQSGYMGTILGHRKDNSKVGFSLLYGFISYMISQALVMLLLFVTALFNSDVMKIFENNAVIDNDIIKLLIILSIIIYIIIITIMNLVCNKCLNKGVNVD